MWARPGMGHSRAPAPPVWQFSAPGCSPGLFPQLLGCELVPPTVASLHSSASRDLWTRSGPTVSVCFTVWGSSKGPGSVLPPHKESCCRGARGATCACERSHEGRPSAAHTHGSLQLPRKRGATGGGTDAVRLSL